MWIDGVNRAFEVLKNILQQYASNLQMGLFFDFFGNQGVGCLLDAVMGKFEMTVKGKYDSFLYR